MSLASLEWEKVDLLEYKLEQEKAAIAQLMKEVDNYKNGLLEVQEEVDRKDIVITRVEAQIRELEQ